MVQLSETKGPTLQESVLLLLSLKLHVEALPSKAEQGVVPKTQPNPFVLHPVKKLLHSSLVRAVVL